MQMMILTLPTSEVARNFLFSKLQTTPALLGAPFVDHQHHTRAEGLGARSR